MIDALLIYPRLGSLDSLVMDMPLSILYAAAESVKRGYALQLLDMRCLAGDWRPLLAERLREQPRLVGVSVMTGQPLRHAKEISLFVRRHAPRCRVVWGGPHVTVLPETIQEPFIDFVVRGYGSQTLADLLANLDDPEGLARIPGLSYKAGDRVLHNRDRPSHDLISFRDLPYHLLEVNHPAYQRVYNGQPMFSLFSSMGCPYQCSFCISPSVLRGIEGRKWVRLPEDEVVAHIAFARQTFGAKHFCFIDDTSFPDLKYMARIFQGMLDQNLAVSLEFRGARINEMDRMDDAFIRLMIRAGTRVLKVGAESGSDRMLQLFKKKITREQIIRVNRKFAAYPELRLDYNFFCGSPGERYEDLLQTKDLILLLVRENPSAYFSFGSDWKPIPGSEMLAYAIREYGYQPPRTLDEWTEMDSFDAVHKIVHPWYTKDHDNLIKMIQMAAFVVDDKVVQETSGNTSPVFYLARLLVRLYRPIAMLRLRYNFYHGMLEYEMFRFMVRIFPRLSKAFAKEVP